jgi:uncharacterized small protein (DUF1192 family)
MHLYPNVIIFRAAFLKLSYLVLKELKMHDEFEEFRPAITSKNLAEWNLEDLQDYITNLEAEITRCKQVIEQKKSVSFAADALFKK